MIRLLTVRFIGLLGPNSETSDSCRSVQPESSSSGLWSDFISRLIARSRQVICLFFTTLESALSSRLIRTTAREREKKMKKRKWAPSPQDFNRSKNLIPAIYVYIYKLDVCLLGTSNCRVWIYWTTPTLFRLLPSSENFLALAQNPREANNYWKSFWEMSTEEIGVLAVSAWAYCAEHLFYGPRCQ